jgi:hypothetical protein
MLFICMGQNYVLFFFTISNFLWGSYGGRDWAMHPAMRPGAAPAFPIWRRKRLALDAVWGWLEMLLAYYPR